MTEISTGTGGRTPAADADPLSDELLQSVVDVARAIFGAQASSVFLYDEAAHELVFQAVSGRGEGHLVGRRFPAGSGIAGWVVTSGEPMVVDDLASSSTFARDLAESTDYVPDAIMAAPLLSADRVLGVVEVLDPAPQSRSSLGELDLLALFARQAAAALRVVVERRIAAPTPPAHDPLAAFAALSTDGRTAALELVGSLERLLRQSGPR
ncbi:GAF domain-containing protein [Actinacidiphila sp. DG2A-62]|jgi:signal transduction protein with GAF and PtsI domain|uniref:GAF domain-containing protein n=1 Tax=Actinacidiphila sp. DG2A-62 TaxID=3108821 RepID=UPI002DBB04CF|nr:GAF domain-containing protein [Actinacidiphila sp. DG2A-62]MEC3992488.1 GAF domain-containing protein [Actinacidiphila sp. DG2A-62]